MSSISIAEAQARLPDLIHGLSPGEELLIVENERPVARLTSATLAKAAQPRQLGTLRGTVLHMATDFDAPLDDFEGYMPRGCCWTPMR